MAGISIYECSRIFLACRFPRRSALLFQESIICHFFGKNIVSHAKNGALTALDIIKEALASGSMKLPEMETSWLPVLRVELSGIPDHESDFVEMMLPVLDQSKFIMAEYGL